MKTMNRTARKILIAVTAAALAALILGLACRGDASRPADDLAADAEARTQWLLGLGWQTDPESEQRQEILLPREFDATLTRYNELQKQQGFDLSGFAGLNATLYTRTVTNWPEPEQCVVADLYVVKGRIVGGDVHSTALDGFMIGLR